MQTSVNPKTLAPPCNTKKCEEPVSSISQEAPTFYSSTFENRTLPVPGYLSTEAKTIFSKLSDDRTEDDIDFVEEEIKEIEFFKRFPIALQRKLAKCVTFVMYDKKRIVVKENREAFAMYIVISGVLYAYKEITNDKTGEKQQEKVFEIFHGMTFGENELLHGTTRDCMIKCRTAVQLLALDKENFDFLIRDMLIRDEAVLEENLKSIKVISEFEWNDEEFKELKKNAKLKRFAQNTIIIGGDQHIPYYIYFIASGECVIEQDVEFTVEHGLGYKRLKPVPADMDRSDGKIKIYKKRLELCRLRNGHFFGMGEDLSKRYVRTSELVEIIMIPRHILILKKMELCDIFRDKFQDNFPSNEQILEKYLEVLNWQKFKQKIMREVLAICTPGSTVTNQQLHKPPFVKYF